MSVRFSSVAFVVLASLSVGCTDDFVEGTGGSSSTSGTTTAAAGTTAPIPVDPSSGPNVGSSSGQPSDATTDATSGTRSSDTSGPAETDSTGPGGDATDPTTGASSSGEGTTTGGAAEDGSSSSGEGTTSSTGGSSSSSGSESSSSSSGGESESESESGAGEMLPLLPQTDEFDDATASASKWQFRHVVEDEPPQFGVFGFTGVDADEMFLEPKAGGWYDDFRGPYVYQHVDGDFMVEAYVEAANAADPTVQPTNPYNSAGLLIRDPGSTPGSEYWILQHLGMHDFFTAAGVERKITIDSDSALVLQSSEFRGRIRICRVGDEIILTRKLLDEDVFSITGTYPSAFPDEVQIGASVTAWNSTGPTPNLDEQADLRASWDYMRFWAITDASQCLQDTPTVFP